MSQEEALGKLSGVTDAILAKLTRTAVSQPGTILYGHHRIKAGKERHRKTMEALRRGTPAGRIPIGVGTK
jgi:hypothetical protein